MAQIRFLDIFWRATAQQWLLLHVSIGDLGDGPPSGVVPIRVRGRRLIPHTEGSPWAVYECSECERIFVLDREAETLSDRTEEMRVKKPFRRHECADFPKSCEEKTNRDASKKISKTLGKPHPNYRQESGCFFAN